MIEVVERKIAYFWRPLPVGSNVLGNQLEAATRALAEAVPAPPADLQRLRNRVADLPVLIGLVAGARAGNEAVEAALPPSSAAARAQAARACGSTTSTRCVAIWPDMPMPTSPAASARAHYEAQWQVRARREMAGMGHVPFRSCTRSTSRRM